MRVELLLFTALAHLSSQGSASGDRFSTPAPPLVSVFLFVRDQPQLLGDWMLHAMRVFSPPNVYVIDNNSTDAAARRILDRARAAGVHIFPSRSKFTRKHRLLSALMNLTRARAPFLVPLDVDEFVGAWQPQTQSYSFGKEAILREFRQLPRDGRAYKFGWVTPHLCGRHDDTAARRPAVAAVKFSPRTTMTTPPNAKNPTGCASKTFFDASSFEWTDQGNHHGRFRCVGARAGECSSCFHTEDTHGLTLVHFGAKHSMTWPAFRDKMMRGAHAYDHVTKQSEEECSGKYGEHYCSFLVEYRRSGDATMEARFLAEQRGATQICTAPDELSLSRSLFAGGNGDAHFHPDRHSWMNA